MHHYFSRFHLGNDDCHILPYVSIVQFVTGERHLEKWAKRAKILQMFTFVINSQILQLHTQINTLLHFKMSDNTILYFIFLASLQMMCESTLKVKP